jgi:hypothetical protein
MNLKALALAILVASGNVAAQAQDGLNDFSKYPTTEIFSGPTKFPSFKGEQRRFATFRTRIREDMERGPNLAGKFSVVSFGCGTSCKVVYIADNKLGLVYQFPLGGEDNLELRLQHNVKSRLVIARWFGEKQAYREPPRNCIIDHFEWVNERAFLLRSKEVSGSACENFSGTQ